MLDSVSINYWAVLVAAVIQMVVGGLWYGPVFGKAWIKLSGHVMGSGDKSAANRGYLIGFIAALVMSYVLAHFVQLVGAVSESDALQLGFWLWLGFFATSMLNIILWEGKSFKLYLLNTLYYLVVLLINSCLLTVWM